MIECVRRTARNVKRWSSGEMCLRWTAAVMLEAERQFRRVIGYRDLAKLAVAVERDITAARPTVTASSTVVKAGRKCTPQRRSKMHPLRVCGRERGEVRRAEWSEWPRARSSRWGAVSTLFAGLRPRSARPAAI
jgi:hypothetical protein